MPETTQRVKPHRRDKLLAAAIDLFRSRGFHAVGIDEIGQAAGISGPGVYRHFANKQALLVAIFDRVAEDLVRQAQRLEADLADPQQVLAGLVDHYASFAVSERSLIAVYIQEERNLDPVDRRRIRKRQRLYLEHWIEALRGVRPDLDGDEALATVHAAIHLISSVAYYEPTLDRDRLRALLAELAGRVLLVGP